MSDPTPPNPSPRPEPTSPPQKPQPKPEFPKAEPRPVAAATPRPEAPVKKKADRPGKRQGRFQPSPRTRRMIGIATAGLVVFYGGFWGTLQRSGWGNWIDFLMGAGVALGLLIVIPAFLWLVVWVLRKVPRYVGYLGFGAFLTFAVLLSWSGFSGVSLSLFDLDSLRLAFDVGSSNYNEHVLLMSGLGVLMVALVVGTLAVVTSGEFGRRGMVKKVSIIGSGLVGLLGMAFVFLWTSENRWLTEEASVAHLVDVESVLDAEVLPPSLNAQNPSHRGTFSSDYLTYGSGTDKRRPEFRSRDHEEDGTVTLITQSVNGKPFTSIPDSWKGRNREEFWGFGIDELPVQGRVWYPEGDGPFPLVLIVHGNHNMADFSDPGYQYLGELMASRGFIFTSVDENFLNGASGRFFAGARSENDARGWMLLEHLRVWREWNETEGHQFFGKVDMDNIALIGHSRGGEAVQHAAVFNRLSHYPDDASVEFDYGFNIKGIVAIAPVDTQYRPADHDAVMENVSFFTIHGSHDADVTRFSGDRMFKRLKFTEPGDFFKSTLYVYRANHGQFNTVWGSTDTGLPRAWLLNQAALLDGDDQRKVAEVYISGFLEATLKGRTEYIDMFRDHRLVRSWLPDVLLVNRFEDPNFRLVTDFEEDVDVTTTTLDGGSVSSDSLIVWREGDIDFRGGGNRGDHGVYLGWNVEEQEKAMAQVMEASVGTSSPATDPDPAAADPADPVAMAQPVQPASYTISLPDGIGQQWQLGPDSVLVLNVTQSTDSPKPKDYGPDNEDENPDEDEQDQTGDEQGAENESDDRAEDEEEEESDTPLDFTVELFTSRGITASVRLSDFGTIPPPLKAQVMRAGGSASSEPVLQTFEIPISSFIAAQPDFVPVDLAGINLVFDRGDKGVVIVDRIGFAQR